MAERTFDQIEQRYQELRDRTLNERLPQGYNEWSTIFNHRLLDNLPDRVAFLDRDFILRQQDQIYKDYLNAYSPVEPNKVIEKCYFENILGSEKQLGYWFRKTRDCGRAETRYDFELRLEYETCEKLTFWDAIIIPALDKKGTTSRLLIFCLDVTQTYNASKPNNCKASWIRQNQQ